MIELVKKYEEMEAVGGPMEIPENKEKPFESDTKIKFVNFSPQAGTKPG